MTDRPRYYDREGRPMSLEAWSAAFEDPEYKRIVFTELPCDRHVSTVWLGLDHNFLGEGPPLIFESMAFRGSSFQEELDVARYSTEAEARVGHKAMVQRLLDEDPLIA
jgi:hypothetical protein